MEAGDFIQTDVFGTYLSARVDPRKGGRLVHVSTDEVYGDIEAGDASREEDALLPLAVLGLEGRRRPPGGRGRAHLRRRRRDHARLEQHGPNQYPEKLIPLFATNLLDGEPVPVYGDGRQVARLHLRRGPLRRHRDSAARARRERRDLQRRRRQRDREHRRRRRLLLELTGRDE